MLFYFFMRDDFTFINTMQKTFNTFQKNVSMPRMDEKKIHTQEFQLKGSGGNMRCKLLQKNIFYQNLTDAFFKYLKYLISQDPHKGCFF